MKMNEKERPASQEAATSPKCRFCRASLTRTFVDLGMSPLCQTHIAPHQLNLGESFYPLHVFVCEHCFLVQLDEYVTPDEIFSEYAYFSSYSDSWINHARVYAEHMQSSYGIDDESVVMEIASNDGYLLQHFVEAGIAVLGIEPAANVAEAAVAKGIPTTVCFFGKGTAREIVAMHGKADLLVGNNVLAHVPDLNDFVSGMKVLLKPDGIITMEFPHLLRLMEFNQFDTIYHEHFSYLSFFTVDRIFSYHGLKIFNVEELATHGGSLRIYACHAENAARDVQPEVLRLHAWEAQAGVTDLALYASFEEKVKETKRRLLEFLIGVKRAGGSVVGYGAPGKGNTLLNYCGIRRDFLEYTVDRNPYKQGKYTPGTRIPIHHPERIRETKPDYVLILPWNLKEEIMPQMEYIRAWGGKFVVPIPDVQVFP